SEQFNAFASLTRPRQTYHYVGREKRQDESSVHGNFPHNPCAVIVGQFHQRQNWRACWWKVYRSCPWCWIWGSRLGEQGANISKCVLAAVPLHGGRGLS